MRTRYMALTLLMAALIQGCGSGAGEGLSSDAGDDAPATSKVALQVSPRAQSVQVTYDPGDAEGYYELLKSDASDIPEVLVFDSDERSLTDHDVQADTLYRYTLNAYDESGQLTGSVQSSARIHHYDKVHSDAIE